MGAFHKTGRDTWRESVARVANAIRDNAAILALPRLTVVADAKQTFRCSDWVAREAYAVARVEARARRGV